MISEVISSLLYRSLIDQQINISPTNLFLGSVVNFFIVFVSSFGIGLLVVLGGSLVMKYCLPYLETVHYGEVILFLSIGIVAYLVAEGYHLSGTTAIRVCGFLLSYFGQYSLNERTYPLCFESWHFLIAIGISL